MRKIIVTVLALLLSGCAAAGERPAALEKSFTCTAVLTGENEYTAQLERAEGSGWSFWSRRAQRAWSCATWQTAAAPWSLRGTL